MTISKTNPQKFVGGYKANTGGVPSLRQTFTNTTNWTVPAGVNAVYAIAIGGGAGGSWGSTTNLEQYGGYGGAGGGFGGAQLAVTAGGTVAIVIGQGGTGGSGTTQPQGNAGGQSRATYGNAYVFANGANQSRPGTSTTDLTSGSSRGSGGFVYTGIGKTYSPGFAITLNNGDLGNRSLERAYIWSNADWTNQFGVNLSGAGYAASAGAGGSPSTTPSGIAGGGGNGPTAGGAGGGHSSSVLPRGGFSGAYTGGLSFRNVTHSRVAGGGGAGYLADGGAATNTAGGAGGSGGGGGGGGASTSAVGGAGGAGAVLIYY